MSTCGVGEMGLLNLWYVLLHQKMRETIEISNTVSCIKIDHWNIYFNTLK